MPSTCGAPILVGPSGGASSGGTSGDGGGGLGEGGEGGEGPGVSGTGGSTAAGGSGVGGSSTGGERIPGTAVGIHGHLSVSGTYLVNEAGTPIQLRGVSSMWLNWENDGYATNLEGLRFMRDRWGVQVIRAAMGVDVNDGSGYAGQGKASMVTQVNQIVAHATTLGIYVIVDFHTHHGEDYLPQAIEFFSDISARYGHLPNLILEPYNEPLRVNWATTLKPYHEAVLQAIRQNDPDGRPNVVILGTPNWDQDIDAVIGQRVADAQTMYTVHFYSCSHGASFLGKAKAAQAAGIPIFVTEWGATAADGGVGGTPVCATEADPWLDWMAQTGVGWAAWKLDNCSYEKQQNGVEDTSCLLKAAASTRGGWTAADLNGHAPYVINRLGCQ